VVLLALAVRLLYLLELRESLLFAAALGDGRQYLDWARQIAAGDWLGSEVFYQAPLYPYLLALATRLVGPELWPLRVLQEVSGALSCGLLALAGRRFFSPRIGLAAGLLLAVYPPAIFFGALIQKSALALLLLCALLALLAVAAETAAGRRSWAALGGAGVVLGALALTRENALILIPVIAVWAVIGPPAPPSGRRRLRLAIFLAGLAVVLLPIGLRNQAVGGGFLLTTSQFGSNLYIGNHAGADGRYLPLRPDRQDARVERADAGHLAEEAMGRKLSADEVSSYWRRRAVSFMTEQPGAWAALMGRKARLLLAADEVVDTESLEAYRAESKVLWVLSPFHFGWLLALAVLGVWSLRRRWREVWLPVAILVALAASVVIFYVVARYRFMLVPPLTLFAAAGLLEGIDRLRRRRWLQVLSAVALLAAVVWWSARPLPIRTHPAATTWYNLGVVLFEAGDDEAARRALERAAELAPEVATIHLQLGRVSLATGDRSTAAAAYRQAAALADDTPASWLAIAQGLALAGDLEVAEGLLRRALKVDPESAPAWNLLANLQAQQGRLTMARISYETAIRIDPELADAHFKLGVLLAETGDLEAARQHLQVAVRLAPEFEEAAQRLRGLEKR